MEQQKLQNPRDLSEGMDSLVSILKYVLSFFMIMLITYVSCTAHKGSVWFSLISAISAGVLALIVCHAMFDGGRPAIKHYYIWMSALLSYCGIAICYTALGVYPFGEESVMIIDMHHQYSAFFSLMREKAFSFGSLSYSDSVGMGSGFLPLIAYYLSSPYNLIALLLPRDNLTEAIALIEVLKITTAGATFAIFCRGVFKKDDYGTVALSVAYALNAYFIAYSWDVMWLDCLVLLPLIVYGLEKVMKGESPLLYCITLGLAITTNYYIGYMICIFLVLWYGMRTFENNRRFNGLSPSRKAAAYFKNFGRFVWTSAVGGMLSMWLLLPTAISLRETSGAEDQFARAVTSNFDFWDIFARTLYGQTPTERGDNLPNVYCSVMAVLLIAIFLTCRKIRLRTRVCFGGLLGLLVVLMANNWTNFAFHGFHFPNDLPYRNSFLVCFTMLAIAVQALDKIDSVGREGMFKAFVIVAGLIIAEQKFGGSSGYATVWYSLGAAALYAVIFGAFPVGRYAAKGTALTVALALCFFEVSANSVEMIHQLNENEVFTDRSDFVEYYDVNKAAVARVGKYNKDGSRMEILPRKTCNDNALYNYSGLTVFASSNPKATTTLMGKLGYAINGVNSYIYNSYVPLADSVLNVKYVVFNHEIKNHAQLSYIDQVSDKSGNRRYIYENSLALSRGFTVDSDIIYWSTNNSEKYENPFEVQNKLVEYATSGAPVYTMLNTEVESEDGMATEINGSYFFADCTGDSGSFTALHTVAEKAQYYIYVDCRAASSINVNVSDSVRDINSTWSVTPYEPYIIDMGRLSETAEVRISVDSDSTCSGNIFLAKVNADALTEAISTLGSHQWDVTEWSDGRFSGTITAEEDCVMFTSIPYSDGWTATVDGKRADIIPIGDALLGVNLPAGSHTVTLRYHTRGLVPGILLTLFGVILLVLWCLRKKVVYPLLKEYVPILSRHIGELNEPQTVSAPRERNDLFGENEEESDEIPAVVPYNRDALADKNPSGYPQPGPQNAQPKPQNAQPKPQNAQPRPQNSQPKPQNAQPRPQNAQPKPQKSQPRPQNSQPRPQNAPDSAVLTEQPKQAGNVLPVQKFPAPGTPTFSTGEAFEITEDNLNAKKKK
jgi:Predicted membrane protein